MSYNTLDKVKKLRIPEATLIMLTDDSDLGIVDEETAAGVIDGGDSFIDGYLRGRLKLPLDPVPDLIPKIALDIYSYEFYSLKPSFEMPKTISDRYTAAVKTLVLIQKGDIKLGAAEIETAAAETSAETLLVSSGDAMFSPDVLDRY
jgi:phage gp36-like protein